MLNPMFVSLLPESDTGWDKLYDLYNEPTVWVIKNITGEYSGCPYEVKVLGVYDCGGRAKGISVLVKTPVVDYLDMLSPLDFIASSKEEVKIKYENAVLACIKRTEER